MAQAANKIFILSKATDVRSEFERLYFENFDKMRGFLYRINGEQNLSDLVQETFLRAWKAFAQFEGRSSVRTWLYRIARNVAADSRRKNEVRENMDPAVIAVADSHLEDREAVVEALRFLDHDHRVVVVLFYYEGFTADEIARTLEIPLGTVKSRLHYAKETLKEKLSEKL